MGRASARRESGDHPRHRRRFIIVHRARGVARRRRRAGARRDARADGSEQVAEEVDFAQQLDNVRRSGSWWSTPAARLPRSTRVRAAGGPVGLTLVEDSLGWTSAHVQPIAAPDGEVIEIDGPEAWAALCRRHPFPLTASRRNVWEWTTGREGMWVQPDWAAVAGEAAGVHLSVSGYLATAGRVIELGDLGASTVAGWGPDETFWFTPVEPSAPEEEWVCDGPAWRVA